MNMGVRVVTNMSLGSLHYYDACSRSAGRDCAKSQLPGLPRQRGCWSEVKANQMGRRCRLLQTISHVLRNSDAKKVSPQINCRQRMNRLSRNCSGTVREG